MRPVRAEAFPMTCAAKMRVLGLSLAAIGTLFTGAATAQNAGIAKVDAPIPRVHITIDELKRTDGGTVTLKFTIVNETPGELNSCSSFRMPGCFTTEDVALLDLPNRKKYVVIRDSTGSCLCMQWQRLAPQSQPELLGEIAGAAGDVTKTTVIFPYFAPAAGIPIAE
jgi:hypothetical protein